MLMGLSVYMVINLQSIGTAEEPTEASEERLSSTDFVMLCCVVERYKYLEESAASIFRVNPEDGGSSKTLVPINPIARHHVPEDYNFNIHSCENLTCHTGMFELPDTGFTAQSRCLPLCETRQ
jgi:hypothetical protein